ncbi:MAG: hypothetical protein V4671_24590 [Armatimonadota bacterium]
MQISKPLAALTALTAVMVASSHAAQAQVSNIIPIRVKLGVFLPNDRDTKDLSNSTHFSGEVDVALPFTGGSGGQTLLSVGYSRGSRGDRSYQVIPVSLTKISSPPNPVGRVTGNVYYGAGVGLYFVRAGNYSVSNGNTGSSSLESKSRTLFGASLVAGYQTPLSFFIEGKYHLVTGSVEGYSPNGLSVFIGKRL